jgi:uncharacterized protein (TIGR02246 family)
MVIPHHPPTQKEIPVLHPRLRGLILALIAAAPFLASCNASSPPSQPAALSDNRAVDEAAIRAADLAWSKAAGDKDPAKTATFYAENAALMAPGSPVAHGRDAIQKAFATMMADPNFALSFAPTKVEVSKSGDMAYDIGDYQLTLSGKKGKPETTKAKYVVVWGKQSDGTWKALADVPNTSTD